MGFTEKYNVEIGAFVTPKGIIILPFSSNKVGLAKFDYLPYRVGANGRREVLFNGQWLEITATVHTHPTGSQYGNGPSDGDKDFAQSWNVNVYGLTDEGYWRVTPNRTHQQLTTLQGALECWGAGDPYQF